LNIIEDMNIISAKLLFKNTCSYVNVYLRALSFRTNIHFILIIDFMLFLISFGMLSGRSD
jgi:hypothetical protein